MTTERILPYAPDYAFPPGDTLAEVLESRGMTQVELAERTGLTPKTVNEIVKAKSTVSPSSALQLQRVLGIPASFWSNMQRRFDEVRAIEAERERLEGQQEWASQFPMAAMARLGWLKTPRDRVARARALLNFLGVASPEAWEAHWGSLQVAFRASTASRDGNALACWLRQGEVMASRLETAPYSEPAFRAALHNARGLTRLQGTDLLAPLIGQCSAAGVAIVFVPELPRIRTYGATRWLSPQKALVQLSLRRKSDDELWFTFFHEAAHILLHPKKTVFIEGQENDDALEAEADRFSRDFLIPEAAYRAFVGLGRLSAADVSAFAREAGIAPGIVVGRLQHDRHLGFHQLNGLKKRYSFTKPDAS